MNNLSQECKDILNLTARRYANDEEEYLEGLIRALERPEIYQSAGLMSVDEMVDFYKWATFNKWELWCHTNWVNKNHTGVLTTTELLNIFRNQNQEKC